MENRLCAATDSSDTNSVSATKGEAGAGCASGLGSGPRIRRIRAKKEGSLRDRMKALISLQTYPGPCLPYMERAWPESHQDFESSDACRWGYESENRASVLVDLLAQFLRARF